jgi:hypothetical protein
MQVFLIAFFIISQSFCYFFVGVANLTIPIAFLASLVEE